MSRSRLLLKTVLSENVEEVKKLIAESANVNCRTFGDRSTPLLLAVFRRNLEIVTALIEANANVRTSNQDGFTPFVVAVRNGDLDIVKKLTEAHDFTPDVLSIIGNVVHRCSMPLHVAVQRKNLEIIRFLLSKGASLSDLDYNANTPLHLAVKRPDFDILRELVNYKGTMNDLDVLNGRNETPLQLAVALRLMSKVFVKEAGSKDYPLDVLRILVFQGAKVTGVNCYRYSSPLSAAMNCYEDDPLCTLSLIKYGMFAYATKSSWQSICNFNEYPFNNEVCQKTLIKYCTLKYADELILNTIETFHQKSFYSDVVLFVGKCETEIENMKKFDVNCQFSLYKVLLQCLIHKKDNFFSDVEDSRGILHKVLDSLCCCRFPIYCDVIASAFREKSHLEAKLMDYCVFTWNLNSTKVILNQECLIEIVKYLSVTDLLNFTVAYFEYHEHLSKTVINNISSITIGS